LETIVTKTGGKRSLIGGERPLTVIGEKINPTGKRRLSEELLAGDFSTVREYAIAQAEAGADILDVNVGVPGIQEERVLPQAVKVIMDAVDLPISIDSANPRAIEAALKVYQGRPIVNSVTGEEKSLEILLPMVKEHDAVLIALTYDEEGPSNDPHKRLAVAQKILERAGELGIGEEDVIVDCLVRPVGVDRDAARLTLETLRLIKQKLGVNTVLGISNVSFGLPDRIWLNSVFLAMAIARGLNCAITDPTAPGIKKTLLAAELLLGHDEFATKWIQYYRKGNVR